LTDSEKLELREENYHTPGFCESAKKKYNLYLLKMLPELQKWLKFDAVMSGNFGYPEQQELELVCEALNIPFIILHKESFIIPGSKKYDERFNEHFASSDSKDLELVQEIKKEIRKNYNFAPPDGESFTSATERFISGLQSVTADPVQAVCIVSHRDIMQNTLLRLFNYQQNDIHWLKEAAISALEYNNGQFKLSFAGRVYTD
jgi:broad specificity phosphatase PhoE